MASVFLYHVVGDLTVGKPELVEFQETETVEAAIRAIGESPEGGIPVWKKRSPKSVIENAEMRQQRFVGVLNSLDIVAFLVKEESLATPVSEVAVPNSMLLKEVDLATRNPSNLIISDFYSTDDVVGVRDSSSHVLDKCVKDLEENSAGALASTTAQPSVWSQIKAVWLKLAMYPNSYGCVVGIAWAFVANRIVHGRPREKHEVWICKHP